MSEEISKTTTFVREIKKEEFERLLGLKNNEELTSIYGMDGEITCISAPVNEHMKTLRFEVKKNE